MTVTVVQLKQELWIKIKTFNEQSFSPIQFNLLHISHKPSEAQRVDLVAVRQEAALLDVSHKPPDRNVIQDKFKVEQLLDGLTELVHLTRTQNIHSF